MVEFIPLEHFTEHLLMPKWPINQVKDFKWPSHGE